MNEQVTPNVLLQLKNRQKPGMRFSDVSDVV